VYLHRMADMLEDSASSGVSVSSQTDIKVSSQMEKTPVLRHGNLKTTES
jgi:hypothetical protein